MESPFHIVMLATVGTLLLTPLWSILFVIPLWSIARRVGWSPWWSLFVLVPIANLVFLWLLAFRSWPRDRTDPAKAF
jgi:hypothetical protein